jgi:hypothetical protein
MSAAAPADARPAARALGAATLGLALGALLLGRRPARVRPALPVSAPPPLPAAATDTGTDSAPQARRLYQAAALLAASVLSDSALEHYRGGFENPGMFAPLASAAVVLACALGGARRAAWPGRTATLPYATACAVGAAGLGFHTYNVLRRPGGLSWANLFYAAPLGAPAALTLAGVIGLAARPVAQGATSLAGLPAGRALCGLAAIGLAGTSAEAALLHFRGAFQHPAMWVPVTVPPVTALCLAGAALPGPARPRRTTWNTTRLLLDACTWLGALGMAFHARGIARQMGGWRNWSQNVLAGPPLPAPPSFSALALAGRAALALRAAQEGPRREAA